MGLKEQFPPLYQCELCERSVSVAGNGMGVEPTIKRSCKCPETTGILARRKVTLRGKGAMDANILKKQTLKLTLTLRQLLCKITGRSI